MNNIWKLLGIEPNTDKRAIRRAYAAQSRLHHPEDEPEFVAELNTAYQSALSFAEHSESWEESEENSEAENGAFGKSEDEAEDFSETDCKDEAEEAESHGLLARLREARFQKMQESRETGAMREFIQLFEDKNRREKNDTWKRFFLSEAFLQEQFSEEFGEGIMHYLIEQEVHPADNLPSALLLELAIAYFLEIYCEREEQLPGMKYPKRYYKANSRDGFLAAECAAAIWNMQGEDCNLQKVVKQLEKTENIARYYSFGDYMSLKILSRNGLLGDPEDKRWQSILIYNEGLLYERNKTGFERNPQNARSICITQLYTQWIRDEQVPENVLAYMYHQYKLRYIGNSSTSGLFGGLKQEILRQFPDIEEQLYGDEGKEQAISKFYSAFAQIISDNESHVTMDDIFEETEEIKKRVEKLFAMPEWEELKDDPRLFQKMYGNLNRRYMPESLSRILIEHYTKADWIDPIQKKPVIENLIRSLHTMRMLKERDYRCEVFFDKTNVTDIGADNADFWQYFFMYGYGFRYAILERGEEQEPEYAIGNKGYLTAYIRYIYEPSEEWQKRFVGFNEETQEIAEPISIFCSLPDGRRLRIEFHLHYVLYFVDEEQVFAPIITFEELCSYAQNITKVEDFFFLLAVTEIGESWRVVAEELIGTWLEKLPFHAVLQPMIGKMLASNTEGDEEEKVLAIRYLEQERFCFKAVLTEKKIEVYRQIHYGWDDSNFREKNYGWEEVPVFGEILLDADVEEWEETADRILNAFKQPLPKKVATYSLEGMDDVERAKQILTAMMQQERLLRKGECGKLHQTDVAWNPEKLDEVYEKFAKEYGGFLTESYCVLHYGKQKGKRYERLFYSAMRPYGFDLNAHSDSYVSGEKFSISNLDHKIKEKNMLLGRFGWGFRYLPRSLFAPSVVALGESGTYYAYYGIKTLREQDLPSLLAKLFQRDWEGATSVDIYEGHLSVSRLDHRLEYCYGEQEYMESAHSRTDTLVDYFTVFGRRSVWEDFAKWMDTILDQGLSKDVNGLKIWLSQEGKYGCSLQLIAMQGDVERIAYAIEHNENYEEDVWKELEELSTESFVWKNAAYVGLICHDVYCAARWYQKYGKHAELLQHIEIYVMDEFVGGDVCS